MALSNWTLSSTARDTKANVSVDVLPTGILADTDPLKNTPIEAPPHQDNSIRFIDNGDGTTTDSTSGLMWMRFAEGQTWSGAGCTGQAKLFSLDQAKEIHQDFAGHADWRLPTVDELKSIVDPSRSNPAFDPLVFLGFEQNSMPVFWTSTSAGKDFDKEGWYYVSFYSGSSFASESQARNSVRLVRNAMYAEKMSLNANLELAAIDKSKRGEPAMAQMNISQFASELRIPVTALLELLHKAGVSKQMANDTLTEQDKAKLLEYLRKSHGETVPHVEITGSDSVIALTAFGHTKGGESSERQTVVSKDSATAAPVLFDKVTEIIERLESLENRFVSSLGRMESLLESPAINPTAVRAVVDLIRRHPALHSVENDELSGILADVQQVVMLERSLSFRNKPSVSPPVYTSLTHLLRSLVDLEAISLAELRRHLLPLDLLPSAVIEEINEKALDLVGEAALEEDGEQVIVFSEVLAQVLDTLDVPSA